MLLRKLEELFSATSIQQELSCLRELQDRQHLYLDEWRGLDIDEGLINRVFKLINMREGVELILEGQAVRLLPCLLWNQDDDKRSFVLDACSSEPRMELLTHMLLRHPQITYVVCHLLWEVAGRNQAYFSSYARSVHRVVAEREEVTDALCFRELTMLMLRSIAKYGNVNDNVNANEANDIVAFGYSALTTLSYYVRPNPIVQQLYIANSFRDTFTNVFLLQKEMEMGKETEDKKSKTSIVDTMAQVETGIISSSLSSSSSSNSKSISVRRYQAGDYDAVRALWSEGLLANTEDATLGYPAGLVAEEVAFVKDTLESGDMSDLNSYYGVGKDVEAQSEDQVKFGDELPVLWVALKPSMEREKEDLLVGCVGLRRGTTDIEKQREGDICRLGVVKSARGCGVARALLHELEIYAQSNGLTRLTATTVSLNIPAISCYIACGFNEEYRGRKDGKTDEPPFVRLVKNIYPDSLDTTVNAFVESINLDTGETEKELNSNIIATTRASHYTSISTATIYTMTFLARLTTLDPSVSEILVDTGIFEISINLLKIAQVKTKINHKQMGQTDVKYVQSLVNFITILGENCSLRGNISSLLNLHDLENLLLRCITTKNTKTNVNVTNYTNLLHTTTVLAM
jgi:ribosomal protein S18 acetylase RimI-like enzyme